MSDVSQEFVWNSKDARICSEILPYEATPKAIRKFNQKQRELSNYCYWFLLGTLWVSYTGWSDLKLWRRLLGSGRPDRETSLMKPSELHAFRLLPETLKLYRAHRIGEQDWISYTLLPEKAAEFAARRKVDQIAVYEAPKAQAICLFLRRAEWEVLILGTPVRTGTIDIVKQ